MLVEPSKNVKIKVQGLSYIKYRWMKCLVIYAIKTEKQKFLSTMHIQTSLTSALFIFFLFFPQYSFYDFYAKFLIALQLCLKVKEFSKKKSRWVQTITFYFDNKGLFIEFPDCKVCSRVWTDNTQLWLRNNVWKMSSRLTSC